jgi:hemoglobin/transferrin/lactoferrin receptor protein
MRSLSTSVGAGADETAGADVIKVTEEEIDRKKPATLRELFVGEPQVQVGGAIPMTQKIYVNGVEETNLTITVDGSRQNNKVFHHNGNFIIDPALLKAVTVSAGCGAGRRRPWRAWGVRSGLRRRTPPIFWRKAETSVGSSPAPGTPTATPSGQALSAYGRSNGFEYLGYINYANGGNFTAGNGEEMEGTATDLLSGLGKIAYESVEGNRFELSHEQVSDDELRPFRANFYRPGPGGLTVRPYDLTRQNTVFSYSDTSPEGWWDPKVVIAYSATDLEVPDNLDVASSFSVGETSSFNGKAENRFALEMGSVTAGFDFYSDKAAYEYVDPAFGYTTDEKAQNIGAYAQARLEPFERTRLSFGGRADHQWFTGVDGSDWTNAGVSGNVSGEYDIVPNFLTAKAGASHVWGGVGLAENYIQNPDWTYGAGPEPATSNNLTAGLEARFNGVTLEANVFKTDIKNARLPTYGRPPTGPDFDIAADARSRHAWLGDWRSL